MKPELTKSIRYRTKIQQLRSGDGNDQRLANVCEQKVTDVAQSKPGHSDHIRDYYLPYYRIRFNMVPKPEKEDGKYCFYYQYIKNVEIGIFSSHLVNIVHSLWINDKHCLHETFKEHQSWDKDKCATKFVNIKNGNESEKLEVFDKDTHFGEYDISNSKIGDEYLSVTLARGPKTNSVRTARSNICIQPINDEKVYVCHGIADETDNLDQLESLIKQLSQELNNNYYKIKFMIYLMGETTSESEEYKKLKPICVKLGFAEVTEDTDLIYFIK